MKRNSNTDCVILFFLFVLSYSSISYCDFKNSSFSVLEAKKLGVEFIEFSNKRSGIEFLGGPFDPNNYDITIEDDCPSCGLVNFEYNVKGGGAGLYSFFQIDIKYYKEGFKSKNLKEVSLDVDGVDLGKKVTIEHIEAIRKSFPVDEFSIADIYSISEPEWPLVVKISDSGKLSLKKASAYNVSKIRFRSSDIIEVTINESLINFPISVDSCDLRVYREQEIRITNLMGISKSVNDYRGSEFLVFGRSSKTDIQAVLEITKNIPVMSAISSIGFDHNSISVVSGQKGLNSRFHSVFFDRPLERVLYKKFESGWMPIMKASISTGSLSPFSSDSNYFFHEKTLLKNIQIDMNRFEWDEEISKKHSKSLTKNDYEQIHEILSRLKTDSNIKPKWFLSMNDEGVVWAEWGSGDISTCLVYNVVISKKGNRWVLRR